MTTLREEHATTLFGVEARAFAVIADASGRIANQMVEVSRPIDGNTTITAELRFDDGCKNGHATFSITGTIRDMRYRGDRGYLAGGCIHDEIARHFPELAHLIKWHLVSTDGPMHYVANTVYLAGDRDYNGLRKGEVRQIRNGKTGLPAWKLECIEGGDLPRYIDSETQPEGVQRSTYVPWNHIGKGKVREFDAARSAAVWPDATDEELSAEPDALRAALSARLPGLMARFRADMDACGFLWWEREKVTP